MTPEIEVRTQDEFDAAIQRGDKAICVSGSFAMTAGRGEIGLFAGTRLDVSGSGCATVRAAGRATVHASGCATVHAADSATVYAADSATVHAWGDATVHARQIEAAIVPGGGL